MRGLIVDNKIMTKSEKLINECQYQAGFTHPYPVAGSHFEMPEELIRSKIAHEIGSAVSRCMHPRDMTSHKTDHGVRYALEYFIFTRDQLDDLVDLISLGE
jgi:hypothetical protein